MPAPNSHHDIPGLPARKTAARLLGAIIDAHTSLDGLTDDGHGHPQYLALEGRDRALVRAILATALRFRVTIEKLVSSRLERPLPVNARSLSHILHVGAAQILFLDVPDSAAVDLAVSHAKSDPRTQRFAGLVNAVLREAARRKDRALPAELARTVDAPEWFRARVTGAYGEAAADRIFAMHRLEAPIDITAKTNPELWAERLGGILLPTGSIRLTEVDRPLTDLDGFAEGAWWVQDAAAALPARLLGDITGLSVADLCAAPGGKTAQLVAAGARVTAVDTSRSRLSRLQGNLERLKLSADAVEADIANWKPPALFDAVLLDAPCSSTGTVRRHPDVPWAKSMADVEKLAGVQARLLRAAIGMVRPGGRVVFSNCSLDPMEGEDLVSDILHAGSGVEHDPVLPGERPELDRYINDTGMLRTTPADMTTESDRASGMDGFFAARLRRMA